MKKYFVFLMTIIMLCGCTHNKKYDKDFQVGFIITTEKKKDSDDCFYPAHSAFHRP